MRTDERQGYRIVLTGGPCAGKTTCLARLSERLECLGLRVFRVPEAATILMSGGASPACLPADQFLRFEADLIRLQMAIEETFTDLAASSARRSIVICDRGTMDAAAYMSPVMWQALLDQQGWSESALRDRRYDAVIHLVTAARGAEEFYTTENNPARTETLEKARELDEKVRNAWVGHPHLRAIDNSTDFNEKIRRVLTAICRIVEVPAPKEIERKFLLRCCPTAVEMPVYSKEFLIEQTYLLTSDGSEARVRRRSREGSSTYTHTVKRPCVAGQRIETEHQISSSEYITLLEKADPNRRTVRKHRRCFLWENQYFELDSFLEPNPGLTLLELELESPDQDVILPSFLDIEREVTEDRTYSNYSIAACGQTSAPSG